MASSHSNEPKLYNRAHVLSRPFWCDLLCESGRLDRKRWLIYVRVGKSHTDSDQSEARIGVTHSEGTSDTFLGVHLNEVLV